ncbi:hypothetical protein BH11VER1_BH11VER1_00980 [soil metagenome]
MPDNGMFRNKEWLFSPAPFPISQSLLDKITALGAAALAFQRSCNLLYRQSVDGGTHAWVARLLDKGKPVSMVALGRNKLWSDALPKVIRPDLILTETGVSITELDSLPGGIGLTGWLGETYAALGDDIVGGASGMVQGFSKVFPNHDVLISRESSDYQPEMDWLISKLNTLEGGTRRVLNPWNITPDDLKHRSIYRFFELWDTANVEHAHDLFGMAQRAEMEVSPPLKPYLEEKLWLALFWSPCLREWWEESLSEEHLSLLRECIPYGWVFDPVLLPLHAEWPQLGIHSWQEMKRFGNKERELVLKISGWSEKSWGSRGVEIGHDLSQSEWSAVIDEALESFPTNPYLLQRFHRGRVVPHPLFDEAKQAIVSMPSRVRLCPYYFVDGDATHLGGVLATVVPSDKKLLHGMRDAIMLPCALEK